MDFRDCVKYFFDLIRGFEISIFLGSDVCKTLADRYHLISVFLYFNRAGFTADDYTVRNFYLALFINHEVYEEVHVYQTSIVKHCLGMRAKDTKSVNRFLDDRFKLFRRMNYNALVDIQVCKNLFKAMPDKIWSRNRAIVHCGVIADEEKTCKYCGYPVA